MILNNNNNSSCSPSQIITFNNVFNSYEDINNIYIFNKTINISSLTLDNIQKYNQYIYAVPELEYAYSVDGVCWSCYNRFSNTINALFGVNSDFFLRIKVNGPVKAIYKYSEQTLSLDLYKDWSISLMNGFDFSYICNSNNTNLYNPYANMDCAIQLQTQLAETVSCMFGLAVYYFKVNGVNSSADITFKEYALKSVENVKQIKLVISDGSMPSSKPEFSDLGLDFQTDWEVEITKGTFATAFGNSVQPQEGDFIYIPMMKRMWSVTGAWEEKSQSLMWVGTSFKISLVKYQDDLSINKENVDHVINDIIKTKYEDLFGDEESLDSGSEQSSLLVGAQQSLQPVFESDACRKYVSGYALNSVKNANTNNSSNLNNTLYYKGTQICDSYYDWSESNDNTTAIIYQRQFCGNELTLSFLLNISSTDTDLNKNINIPIITIGSINIFLKKNNNVLYIESNNLKVELTYDKWYFIVFRASKTLNTSNLICASYKYPDNIPTYKIQKFHYYFDIDNASIVSDMFSNELSVVSESEVKLNCFNGFISNIKLLNIYNDNLSELLMQNPTNQHLLINDTVLPFLGLYGPNQY